MAIKHKKCEGVKILADVSRLVSSSLDLDKVCELVLKESIKALDVDHASLFLIDDEMKHLLLAKVRGFSKNEADNIRLLGSWEVINDYLIRKKSALRINDMDKDPRFSKASLPFSHEKLPVKSFLAVSLKKDNKIIGTLIASNRKRPGHLFNMEDEELLLGLSNNIAIAIANAQLFEELSRAQAEAAQSEKMAVIGTLAAGINHEISNPLGIARATCDVFLLNKRDGIYKDKTQEDLLIEAERVIKEVINQTEKATSIAKNLSNFAKPSGAEAESVNMGNEVDVVLNLVGYELKLEKIEVEKQIETDLPDIFVNKKQAQEVLFNLIRNAGQAITNKGKITINAVSHNGNIIIDIKDTGSGIPKDKMKELFKPFFTTKAPGKGTGLGLFIVRKIVEKNGGQIYLKDTKPGVGTTFTLEFPAVSPGQGAIRHP